MYIIPPALDRLIQDLNRLPGIGKKTATRLAIYILRRPAAEARALAKDFAELHCAIRLCSNCNIFSQTDPCEICTDPKRNSRQICVVEEAGDLMAVEKTGVYRGQYHVLHGVLSPIDGMGPDEIKLESLVERIRRQRVVEVLIATSSTVPGEATAAYLTKRLQAEQVRITRLACGIPMGMDIKYADEITLGRALESRKDLTEENPYSSNT